MNILYLSTAILPLDFSAAKRLADAIASHILTEEAILLSWYDRERNYESPAHVSECHQNCETPGYWDYALNRGGELVIDIEAGKFVFCYRRLGEFGI